MKMKIYLEFFYPYLIIIVSGKNKKTCQFIFYQKILLKSLFNPNLKDQRQKKKSTHLTSIFWQKYIFFNYCTVSHYSNLKNELYQLI